MRRFVDLGLVAAIAILGGCGDSVALDATKVSDAGSIVVQVPCGVPGEWTVEHVSVPPEARPRGAACAFGVQCASGLCSANREAGTCGVCVERRFLGEPCGGPLVGCAKSATCSGGICRSKKKVAGEACGIYPKGGDQFECDDELFCDPGPPPWSNGAGVCAPLLAAGSACELFQTCAGELGCREGICAAWPPPTESTVVSLPLGAPCGLLDGRLLDGECAAGTACRYEPEGDPNPRGACVTLPASGEPCPEGRCAAGLICARRSLTCSGAEAGTRCEPLRTEGEPCESSSSALRYDWESTTCAPGLECRNGRCERPCV